MTDRKDDVDMPDEIWVYGQPKDFGIKGHDDEYLAHSDPQIALKEHDVKYTRADKAEPAIDVEGLREDIIQHTSNRIACDQSVRESIEMCIGWAFDTLASRNLIRTETPEERAKRLNPLIIIRTPREFSETVSEISSISLGSELEGKITERQAVKLINFVIRGQNEISAKRYSEGK